VKLSRVLIGALAACVLGGAAYAQAPAAPAAPPKPDVKVVEDWTVRCYPVQSISPCDMYQEQGNAQTQQRVLSVSIAFAPSVNRHLLVINVPLEVAIPKGVVMQTDTYTSPVLKYRMCNREGCFVQTAVDNSLVEALARASGKGKINLVGDDGRKVALPFSLKGFSAAHDDMVSQARAKATSKPAEPAAPAAP
jgi:invasion protein IalB